MKAKIQLTIALDGEYIVARAERRGVAMAVIARELAAELEGAAVDACRWRDGVERGGVASTAALMSPQA